MTRPAVAAVLLALMLGFVIGWCVAPRETPPPGEMQAQTWDAVADWAGERSLDPVTPASWDYFVAFAEARADFHRRWAATTARLRLPR